MKTGCISHVAKDALVILRKSYLEICDGSKEAAILLSFFEYWHNVKAEMARKNAQMNAVAEKHGEAPVNDTSLLQWHTRKEIYESCMGLVAFNRIKSACDALERLGFISRHKNPNPKYRFDKTTFFMFHPSSVQSALNDLCASSARIMRTVRTDHSNATNDSFTPITETTTEITTETTTDNNPPCVPPLGRWDSAHVVYVPSQTKQKKETPRQVLEHVLSPEDASAVIEHRQRLRKPLTPRAAKILANAFSEIEPEKRSEAVDMMIVSGWTGFKAEWFNNRQQKNAFPSSRAGMQPSEELAERVMGMMQGRIGRHSMIAIIKWAISRRSFMLSKDVDAVIVEIGMLVNAIENRIGEDAVDEIMALAIEDLTNEESGAKLNADMIMQRYNSMLREWRGRTKEVYDEDGVRFETVLTPEGERLHKRIAERFGNNLLEHDSDGE